MKATMKKVLSLVIVLTMVAATMMIVPLTANAKLPATDLLFLGQGTKQNPYVIDSVEDLKFVGSSGTSDVVEIMGQEDNKVVYMELGADIDMAGVTDYKGMKMANGYNIIFDGKGYTISNVTIEDGIGGFWVGGLFGLLRGAATGNKDENGNYVGDVIKNLTMENVTVNSNGTNQYVGGIVGEACAPFVMENCLVAGGSVSAGKYTEGTSSLCIGGLVGNVHSNGDVRFDHCVNTATVTNTGNDNGAKIGGIVGGSYGLNTYAFNYCYNMGDLTDAVANQQKAVEMGGIFGSASAGVPVVDGAAQVYNHCVNEGNLFIADVAQSNAMGGIVGSARQYDDTTAEIKTAEALLMTNCYDYSARTFAALLGYNGAMAGYPSRLDDDRTFVDCYAVNAEGSTNPYTGFCYADPGAEIEVTLDNSAIVATIETAITLKGAAEATTMDAEFEAIQVIIMCALENNGHVFDNACDTDCNEDCGYVRADAHEYDNDCDAECNLCEAPRTAPHAFGGDCDTECDDCGATREAVGAHTYANDCDSTCDGCGLTRKPKDHVYDDDDDAFCNVCNDKREAPGKKPATTTAAPATTTAAAAEDEAKEEKKGCKGAINSTYAVLALVGVLGFAFVAKKREEN